MRMVPEAHSGGTGEELERRQGGDTGDSVSRGTQGSREGRGDKASGDRKLDCLCFLCFLFLPP